LGATFVALRWSLVEPGTFVVAGTLVTLGWAFVKPGTFVALRWSFVEPGTFVTLRWAFVVAGATTRTIRRRLRRTAALRRARPRARVGAGAVAHELGS
jgi:hypothetical protein